MYHDATDEPLQTEEDTGSKPMPCSENFHGGFGSESLKERIELLNANVRNSPATLHSGVSPTEASAQPSGSVSLDTSQKKGKRQELMQSYTLQMSRMRILGSKPMAHMLRNEQEDVGGDFTHLIHSCLTIPYG